MVTIYQKSRWFCCFGLSINFWCGWLCLLWSR